MRFLRTAPAAPPIHKSGEKIRNWQLGRISPMPSCVPKDWNLVALTSVARLESGHTPSRNRASYWSGNIPWISLHDSAGLDKGEITTTKLTVSEDGLANSSARLLPKGTVVFSRTATVGKCTIMGRQMATSQDFANYVCGTKLNNRYLMYLFRFMSDEWTRVMAGSTHNTIYMPIFQALQILLPPIVEQEAIAEALSDADALIESLEQLIAKKRQIKQGVMQELLTGKTRLHGFNEEWREKTLGDLGTAYGGLSGKTKADFGVGSARYITFMNVMTNVVIDRGSFARVTVSPTEKQNRVRKGDLFFNGSSEVPKEVGMCAILLEDVEHVYLNSFCFGFRLRDRAEADGTFLAYHIRSTLGREVMQSLAQGSTRYNLSKSALLTAPLRLPKVDEQRAIAKILRDIDAEILALEVKLRKAGQVKQGMMQQLLTGRIRLV